MFVIHAEEFPESRSIHPRVFWGTEKVNTMGKKRKSTLVRAITALNEHIARHPGDAQSVRHRDKLVAQHNG